MLKKTFFLIFIFAFASAYAQNTNVKVVKPKPVAANTAVNAVAVPTPKKTPRPKVKATPVNVDIPTEMYGEPKTEEEPANSTIRGRVFYEDSGRAVKRCSIMLMPKNLRDGGSRDYSGLTDGNGYFQIKNVKAGSYYAVINAPGVVSPLAYADVSKQRDEEGLANAFDSFEAITVNGINDTEVQVPARRGGAISGRVMYDDGDTAIGVNVQILRKVGDNFIPVIPNFSVFAQAVMQTGGVFKTDDRGYYRFSGLPTGDYIVKVTEDASHNEESKGYGRGFEDTLFGGSSSLLTMFYPDVFETSKAQIINLQIGQETTEINITIPNRQTHKIEGKIISGKDKLPIANAKIILKKVGDNSVSFFDFDDRRKPTAKTDNEGKFYFKEIPSGSYKAVIEASNSIFNQKKQIYGVTNQDDEIRYAANSAANSIRLSNSNYSVPEKKYPKFSKKSQEITVEDKDLENLTVELGFGATISGTVLVENSQEMPKSFSILAKNADDEVLGSAMVNNYYTKDGVERNFELEGIAEGTVKFDFYSEEFWVKSATLRNVDVLAKSFEVKESEVIKGLQIVLSKEVGTLKGKVLNAENELAKKQTLIFVPTDSAKRKSNSFTKNVVTDENGEFEIKLPPFEFAILFAPTDTTIFKNQADVDKWFDEQIKNAEKITIEINKTQTISVKMKKM
jgi:hypothetical protein